MISVLHGDLVPETKTGGRLRTACNRTQSGPGALPFVTGVITEMTMTHYVSPGFREKSLVPQHSDQRLPDRLKETLQVGEGIFQEASRLDIKAWLLGRDHRAIKQQD